MVQTIESHLQQRTAGSKEIEKLFGTVIPAKWPKATTNATCHNDTIIVFHYFKRLEYKTLVIFKNSTNILPFFEDTKY